MSDKDKERYMEAAHAVQTGVMYDQEATPDSFKHLRTGVNSAMVNSAAIASLLIARGVFTKEEYVASLADEMEREQARYEALLTERFGREVKLA